MMSFHPVGASMIGSRIPAHQQPSYFDRGIPGMLAPRGTVRSLGADPWFGYRGGPVTASSLGAWVCPPNFVAAPKGGCKPANARGCYEQYNLLMKHSNAESEPYYKLYLKTCLSQFATRVATRGRLGLPIRGRMNGLGQLSMPAETQAALQACSNTCDAKHGVPSGNPDFFSLTACFANCNLQSPPTVTIPGVTTPPAAELPPPPGPVIDPSEPTGPPQVTPSQAGAGGDMKMWVIGGAVAVAAVGAFLYFRKK